MGWDVDVDGMPSPTPGIETVHMFSKGDLHGALVLMEEGHQVVVADATNTGRIAITTNFCVKSIEETVEIATKAGGKLHVYVLSAPLGSPLGSPLILRLCSFLPGYRLLLSALSVEETIF
jgi:hypothetical protein